MTGFDSSDYKLAREDNTFLQLPTMSVDAVIYARAIKSTAYRLPALHSSGKSTSDTYCITTAPGVQCHDSCVRDVGVRFSNRRSGTYECDAMENW